MSVSTVSKLPFQALVVLTAIIYYVATSTDGPTDAERAKVEELFIKTHPNLDTLDKAAWELADQITEEKLETACRDVEVTFNPDVLTKYVDPNRRKPLKLDRLVPRAPVLLTVDGSEKTVYAKLLNCTFVEMQFFLAQGNDKDHVFCLDQVEDGKFRLRSGLHEINKSAFMD